MKLVLSRFDGIGQDRRLAMTCDPLCRWGSVAWFPRRLCSWVPYSLATAHADVLVFAMIRARLGQAQHLRRQGLGQAQPLRYEARYKLPSIS